MILNAPSVHGGVIPYKKGPRLALGFNTFFYYFSSFLPELDSNALQRDCRFNKVYIRFPVYITEEVLLFYLLCYSPCPYGIGRTEQRMLPSSTCDYNHQVLWFLDNRNHVIFSKVCKLKLLMLF